MSENEIPRNQLELRDDPEVISPPIVDSPLYACATAVTVRGFIAHADLELEIDGGVLPPRNGGFPDPDGFAFTGLTPLEAAWVVRARQIIDGVTSAWSQPVTVKDHKQDLPAGPPRPTINPEPVFECGARTGVSNLLTGSNVWIESDGAEVGRVDGAKEHQGVNVTPDYGHGQRVRAYSSLCDDPSPPSEEYVTQHPPAPLPTPAIDETFEDAEQIRITNLVNGARFTIDRGGTVIGPIRTWGYAHLVGLTPPFSPGETISVTQRMCPSDPESPPGSTTVNPCAELPAPTFAPVQVGDAVVRMTSWVPGARIKVFANSTKIGDGGGALIALTRPVQEDETIYVYQVLGDCESETVWAVEPRCVAPPVGADPAGVNLFPVGRMDYAAGDFKGSVYYPAEDDGENQPFNARWGEVRRSPIVFMAHGNHATRHDPDDREEESSPNCDPPPPPSWPEIANHKGYNYFQRQLARMGFVAVSVDCNETNGCTWNDPQNIERRAELLLGSMSHFQGLDAGDPTFGGRLDFNRVGLMGHSRGGEAVIIAGNQAPGTLGVNVQAVISLAPVNHDLFTPDGYAFMTILPASDGDVSDNGGARFYDIAPPQPFKSQLYIDSANHNYFNREWVTDEAGRLPPDILSRSQHERILSSYGCAFLRTILMDHSLAHLLTYRTHPPGIDTNNVHLSFEWRDQLTVDDHEQPNGIEENSLNRPTSQSSAALADEYQLWRSAPSGHSSGTFWGKTVGMVAEARQGETFRSALDDVYDLRDHEIWVRTAEVSSGGPNPSEGTGFEMGLEDEGGARAWLDSDEVGGLPRPFDDAPGSTKTMLTTLRFPVRCLRPEEGQLDASSIVAVLFRFNRSAEQPIAFDVLQVVREP